MENTLIRPATKADAESIAAIYNHYVETTAISFEESAVPVDEMAGRIAGVTAASLPWLVAECGGKVVGFAYATQWKTRHAYRFSAECTVYLAPDVVGGGLGSKLYAALFAELRNREIHVAIGCVALPNAASIALHEKMGMTQVAHFKEVGYKFGRWIDIGYWQCAL